MKASAPSLKLWPGFTDTAGEFNGVLQPCGTFGGGMWGGRGFFCNAEASARPIQPLTSGSSSFTVPTFFWCVFLSCGVTVCSVRRENLLRLKSSEDQLSAEPINSGIRYAAAASGVAGA